MPLVHQPIRKQRHDPLDPPIAVRRDRDGTGTVIDAAMAASEPAEHTRMRWLAKVQGQGASELHIHRLAATEDDRRAIFEDLREDETQAS